MKHHHIPAPKGIYEGIADGTSEHFIAININDYGEGDVIVFREVYRSDLLLKDAATGRECRRTVASTVVLPYLSGLHGV